jgi:hypothetical protein
VIVHSDDENRRSRRRPSHERQRAETGGSEHRVVEDDDVSRNPIEQANEVRQVGGGADRLDAHLALEDIPERRPDPRVAGRDDDRDGSMERNGLSGHDAKDRRAAGSAHPRTALNRRP